MGALPRSSSIPSSYVFDNAAEQASARLSALSEIFDPGSIRHLNERGVDQGWCCLEIGGGNGSIASWLSRRVGPTGSVLVTDIDTRFLETVKLPNCEVRRHNIVTDSLPEGAFDLVHSRLVLLHLPERDRALRRMVAALKPGGWLLDEEFDSASLLADPVANPGGASQDSACPDAGGGKPWRGTALRTAAAWTVAGPRASRSRRGGSNLHVAGRISGCVSYAGQFPAASRRHDPSRLHH